MFCQIFGWVASNVSNKYPWFFGSNPGWMIFCWGYIPFPQPKPWLHPTTPYRLSIPRLGACKTSRMTVALVPMAQCWLLICCWLSSWLPARWQWSWPRVSSSFVVLRKKTCYGDVKNKKLTGKDIGSDTKKKCSSIWWFRTCCWWSPVLFWGGRWWKFTSRSYCRFQLRMMITVLGTGNSAPLVFVGHFE